MPIAILLAIISIGLPLVIAGLVYWAILLIVRERLRKPVAQRRDSAKGRFVSLPNGQTYVVESGDPAGQTFVLIHGLTTPSYVFDAIAPTLATEGHHVITYDHYGRGLSDRPKGRQDAAMFTSHLSEILDALDVQGPVTLVGYSMGGAIASCAAARMPERVRDVVLIAPAGMQTNLGGLVGWAVKLPLLGRWLMHAFYPGIHRAGTEEERALDSKVSGIVDRQQDELNYRGFIDAVLASLKGVLRHPLDHENRDIGAHGLPVTAIWGEDDAVIPLASKDLLTKWNPAVRHVIVEGAGHGLTYTHPSQVLTAMPR